MYLTRLEWLVQRQKGIQGNDIACVFGMTPWSSPIKVYQDKIGKLPPPEETEVMYWWNVLGEAVAKEFQKRAEMKVRTNVADDMKQIQAVLHELTIYKEKIQ